MNSHEHLARAHSVLDNIELRLKKEGKITTAITEDTVEAIDMSVGLAMAHMKMAELHEIENGGGWSDGSTPDDVQKRWAK